MSFSRVAPAGFQRLYRRFELQSTILADCPGPQRTSLVVGVGSLGRLTPALIQSPTNSKRRGCIDVDDISHLEIWATKVGLPGLLFHDGGGLAYEQ
jgi:hypothetical protein